jgi:hypothetical protein
MYTLCIVLLQAAKDLNFSVEYRPQQLPSTYNEFTNDHLSDLLVYGQPTVESKL